MFFFWGKRSIKFLRSAEKSIILQTQKHCTWKQTKHTEEELSEKERKNKKSFLSVCVSVLFSQHRERTGHVGCRVKCLLVIQDMTQKCRSVIYISKTSLFVLMYLKQFFISPNLVIFIKTYRFKFRLKCVCFGPLIP